MKLYYFKDPQGNFGDDLNPWLWDRLLPEFFDDDESELFVGIGTLLNDRIPAEPRKHVFGSGLGYGAPPNKEQGYLFHAVRGYKTAHALNLPSDLVITDAAVLVRAVDYRRALKKDFCFGFIPTGHTLASYDWQSVCMELGFNFISPHGEVEDTLYEMSRCEVLICEAMHGAIVADAMRIPWLPINCSNIVLAFKWEDWLGTMGLAYDPTPISFLQDTRARLEQPARMKNLLKTGLKQMGMWSSQWSPPMTPDTGPKDLARVLDEMRGLTQKPAFLSADSVVKGHTERYLELLKSIRR